MQFENKVNEINEVNNNVLIVPAFNDLSKVSFNRSLKMYYDFRSKLVFKSKLDKRVIGRIYKKTFVPYDWVTQDLCQQYGFQPDPETENKQDKNEMLQQMENEYIKNSFKEYMIMINSVNKENKEKKKPIKVLNETKNFKDTKTDKQDEQCIFCCDNKKVIVLIPCGHICYCNSCLKQTQQIACNNDCPLCKTKVESAILTFD